MHLPVEIRYLSRYGWNSSGMIGIKTDTKWECNYTGEGAEKENFSRTSRYGTVQNWLPCLEHLATFAVHHPKF